MYHWNDKNQKNKLQSLESLREEINSLDLVIVEALIKRFHVAKQIGTYKLNHNLAILDEKREKERLEFVFQIAKELDSQEFNAHLCAIYEEIFKASKQIQKELLSQEKS